MLKRILYKASKLKAYEKLLVNQIMRKILTYGKFRSLQSEFFVILPIYGHRFINYVPII